MEAESEKTENISGGEAKVREYANRIIDEGEDYDSIVNGLGPTMTAAIDAAIERRGYDIPTEHQDQLLEKEKSDFEVATKTPEQVAAYVAKITENRPEQVQELYKRLLENIDNEEQRMVLITALIGDTYRNLRTADYGINTDEDKTWEQTKQTEAVQVKESNEWMYRGVFPQGEEETVTRGSFNVTVTPELVDTLDTYIASGKVKANYKFGQPGTGASPQERHDAISIYFLEQPSDDVLQELSDIIKPYVRGDDLLGRKVAEGFYLSEVGSIQDEHIEHFVEMFDGVDSSFAEAVKRYASDRKGRAAMSEAQYYAVKKVAEVFGYDLTYNNESGFDINLLGDVEQQANFEGNDSELLFDRLDNLKILDQIVKMWMAGYRAKEGKIEQRPKQDEDGGIIFDENGNYILEDVPFVPPSEEETREKIAELINEAKTSTPVFFDARGPSVDGIGLHWKLPNGNEPTPKQKSIILAHEKGHVMRQFPGGMEGDTYFREMFGKAFDMNNINYTEQDFENDVESAKKQKEVTGYGLEKEDYTYEHMRESTVRYLSSPEEIVERMGQLKNYFGFSGDEEFTQAHLDYARGQYIKDTGLDNSMRHFFESITDDQEFLRLINSVGV